MTVQGFTACLFHDERQRVAFVQEPQFSFRVLPGAGVQENTALDQYAVNIAHHAADIPKAVILVAAMVDIPPHFQVEFGVISLVDRIKFTGVRDAHIAVTEAEFTNRRIKCESIDAIAGRID